MMALWSDLPMDILRHLFESLSFVDFHRAKMVCSNWYSCSKQTVRPKKGSPLLLLLSPEEEDGFRLYSPDEDRVYEQTKSDEFSGYRFLGNSGKWFLVVDPRTNLYIVDVFSDERIGLPPIDSIEGGRMKLTRSGDKAFRASLDDSLVGGFQVNAQDLRGLLWVDDDKSGDRDYVVVWKFEKGENIGFCKKGDHHYREIHTRIGVDRVLRGAMEMVLKGYTLYLYTDRQYVRRLDLSGPDGFKDVPLPEKHMYPLRTPEPSKDGLERMRAIKLISVTRNIAVTTSGEVLFVKCTCYYESSNSDSARNMMFRVYKRDPKDLDPEYHLIRLVEVDSLGDEALFLDLGTTVPADPNLGIHPNSIYFTRGDRLRPKDPSCLHICVYNLATRETIKHFPTLSCLNLKDAHWFLPS